MTHALRTDLVASEDEMAKRKVDNVKPLFPLKHEFIESLNRYIHEASMLADVIDTALKLGAIDTRLSGMVIERLSAFNAARYGDDSTGGAS